MPNMSRILSIIFCVVMLSALMPHANAASKQANVYTSMYEGPAGYEQYCSMNDPNGEYGESQCTHGNTAAFIIKAKKVSLELEDDQSFISGSRYYQDNKYTSDGFPMTTVSRAWDGVKPFKTVIKAKIDGEKVKLYLKDVFVTVYDESVPYKSSME